MLTNWSKNFERTLKAYFLTEMPNIWLNDYRNENTSNDIFHFFISDVEHEFQQI